MDEEQVTTHENCILRTISVVPDSQMLLTQPSIQDAVRSAEQNYRGWPVLSLWHGEKESIEVDGLVCTYKSDDLGTIFYWKIGRDGKILHVFRLCWSEKHEDKSLPATIIVIELSEFLATICDLYRRLQFPDATSLSVKVQYDNVKGAMLPTDTDSRNVTNAYYGQSRRFKFEPIVARSDVPISTLPEQVGPYVHTLFRELVDQHTSALAFFDEQKVIEWSLKTVQRRL